MSLDPQLQELLLSFDDENDPVFVDYIELVANESLRKYQSVLQYGKKQGQSLYNHVLGMICVLETLRPILSLTTDEVCVLYIAITIHDINKVIETTEPFSKLATADNLSAEIRRLNLNEFFDDWQRYLKDIITLVRNHSGHYHVSGESWIAKREEHYGLGLERVKVLGHLLRAVDALDLSHTLTERKHKEDFLGHLNTYFAESNIDKQYEFHTHQLVEQRGLLTNIIHNALMSAFSEEERMLPVLLYPDGVAYLAPKGTPIIINEQLLTGISETVDRRINTIIADVEGLVDQTHQGIKVKPDALIFGVSMEALWQQVRKHVAQRNFKVEEIEEKARVRTLKHLSDDSSHFLEEGLVTGSNAQMRSAEMARTYYIFLTSHFGFDSEIWTRIYQLLDLPEDRYEHYNLFDARWDRAYILAGDIVLTEEEVYERIIEDSKIFVRDDSEGSKSQNLWMHYLSLYLLIDDKPITIDQWESHLAQYVTNQHQQCIHCSGPFPTQEWMAGDVRNDITVQVFSNRLLGGSKREPKKNICAVCRVQFFIEALNYPNVRDESLFYIHLFPYSYLTTPFLEGLNTTFHRLHNSDFAVQALNMDIGALTQQIIVDTAVRPYFRFQTKKGKPQPYGIYVPYYSDTTAGVMIFPLNPAGDNDTEKYLFALWNVIVLQRLFGVRAMLSKGAVPPLEEVPDLYLDMIPLACEGLLPRNDYAYYVNGDQLGPLNDLWLRIQHIFALRRLLNMNNEHTAALVRAMSAGPLRVFFVADRLIEKANKGLWTAQDALLHLDEIALSLGGFWMHELSSYLQQVAKIGWKSGIRGRQLNRNSLLYPLKEIFDKMNLQGGVADRETLMAATIQDIFNHLERIADNQYKPGRTKLEAIERYVRIWYDNILGEIYEGNIQKLLADEKLLRSAYLFYVQSQIPRKATKSESEEA